MLKQAAKKGYLSALFALPHNNIFEFHHVSAHPEAERSKCKMDTGAFQDFIRRHGPYASLEKLIAARKLEGLGAVTFDDGLADLYTAAYPFLREEKIPFTAFILPAMVGKPGYVTADQLREMADDPLVTVGSHGMVHERHGRMTEKEQRASLFESKARLEDLLGRPCRYFAYPFGSYTQTTAEIAKAAGYENACAVKGRPVLLWNRGGGYDLPRLSVWDETRACYERA